MGRLKTLGSRLQPLAPRLKAAPKIADGFYSSPEWRATIKQIKSERGNWCEICGSTNRVIGDHIIERKDGGAPLDPANIQLLCITHHNTKTARERAKRAKGQT